MHVVFSPTEVDVSQKLMSSKLVCHGFGNGKTCLSLLRRSCVSLRKGTFGALCTLGRRRYQTSRLHQLLLSWKGIRDIAVGEEVAREILTQNDWDVEKSIKSCTERLND